MHKEVQRRVAHRKVDRRDTRELREQSLMLLCTIPKQLLHHSYGVSFNPHSAPTTSEKLIKAASTKQHSLQIELHQAAVRRTKSL